MGSKVMARIPQRRQEGGDVSSIGKSGFTSLAVDPELLGNISFTPAPELTESVVALTPQQKLEQAYAAKGKPTAGVVTPIATGPFPEEKESKVRTGQFIDENRNGIDDRDEVEKKVVTIDLEPTVKTEEKKQPLPVQQTTAPVTPVTPVTPVAKIDLTKPFTELSPQELMERAVIPQTLAPVKTEQTTPINAFAGYKPLTGTEYLQKAINKEASTSLLGDYLKLTPEQQKIVNTYSTPTDTSSFQEQEAKKAQAALDYWSKQDYDPNKYKVADDASFMDKIKGYSRIDDNVFQIIARGEEPPEGSTGFYAEMAKLGDQPYDVLKEVQQGVNVSPMGTTADLSSLSPIRKYMLSQGIPDSLVIPGSSSSEAAGLVGHADSARVFLNTGEDLNKLYPNLAGKGQWIIPEGGGQIGAYDIQYIPKAYQQQVGADTFAGKYIFPVTNAVMSFYNPAFAVAQVATKAAAGQTLHLNDYAAATIGGLKASGLLAPPTEAVEATATTPAIPASAGQGLLGFSYDQSIKGLNTAIAAAKGDFAGAVVSQFGGDLTEKVLGGKDGEFLTSLKDNYNINTDDFIKGLVKSEQALVNGASLGDAVLQGVGKYIVEGGSLRLGTGGIETPEILKKVEDVVRTVGSAIDQTVIQPVKETLPLLEAAVKAVAEPVIEAGSAVNREVVKPVFSAVEEAGSAINREVVKPVVGAVGEVAKQTGEVIQAVTEPVIDVIDDVLDSTYDAINQLDNFIDDIDLPDISLPNINLPNLNLPNVNLNMNMSLLTGIGGGGRPIPTQTTTRRQTPIDLQFDLQELEKLKQQEFIGRYL